MDIDLGDLNWLAVVVVAIAAYALGAGWYGVLANPWMAATGLTREIIKSRKSESMRAYGLAAAAAFGAALAMAVVVQAANADGLMEGLVLGLVVGVGLVGLTTAAGYAFEFRPLKLYLINAGYSVAQVAIGGMILATWT